MELQPILTQISDIGLAELTTPLGERSEPQSRESSIKVALIPTLNCSSGPNLISYGQSNIILLIINKFSYISVILELICDILDLNFGKIQLQFTAT